MYADWRSATAWPGRAGQISPSNTSGGRVRVFVVDRYLIERLLEFLEYGEAWPPVGA